MPNQTQTYVLKAFVIAFVAITVFALMRGVIDLRTQENVRATIEHRWQNYVILSVEDEEDEGRPYLCTLEGDAYGTAGDGDVFVTGIISRRFCELDEVVGVIR